MAVRFRLGAPEMIRIIFSLFLFLFWTVPVQAIYDPLTAPNNKYGIHIADFNDIPDISALINSTGGDWGYVTIVATDNDRNREKWQNMFDSMRRLHIIPLVRIATHPEKAGWKKPDRVLIKEIVKFFNSLNWPTANRYVILFNEPNHAGEWGGEIDPEGYASIALEFARTFKEASPDFFVLPAGLDVSAASDGKSLDAAEYLRRMIVSQPALLDVFDGWTSHSYPNPAFSGSPHATGRGTLRSFEWELGYLRNLGLTKKLPVFITETGWVHNEGKNPSRGLMSPETVGENLKIAASSVWTDDRIVAITPFVFNYQDVPFDTFSWKKLGKSEYYPHYSAYQSLEKTKGMPTQHEYYVLSEPLLPPTLVSNSSYTLTTKITNKGQGILSSNGGYEVFFDDGNGDFVMLADSLPVIEPGEEGELRIHLKTPQKTGEHKLSLTFKHGDTIIPVQERTVQIVPPPSVRVTGQLGWRPDSDAQDATVLVYDDKTLIQKFTGLTMKNGTVTTGGLSNVVPGKPYRIVLLVPFYLPRQTIAPLSPQETAIRMKRSYPFDIDKDGTFTPGDLWALLTNRPHNMINLFVGP
jgi:hypothetical protein